MLALRGLNYFGVIMNTCDLLFVVIVGKLVFELGVRVEARPDLVYVLSLQALFF